MHPYPFEHSTRPADSSDGGSHKFEQSYVRGRIASQQASHLRRLFLEAHEDATKIVAYPCSYDGLSSRLVEEAGFPMVFLSGFAVSSAAGLPDVGYLAMQEMCDKVQEVIRQVSVPIMVDGDTGYGGPMNVRRTVQSFALAGAAGVMIEDQTWPKRCGHTKGKSVVSRGEAYARIKAAVDARNEGVDIFILGRTDSLLLSYDEAIARAREYLRIGADAVFIEALPDRETMQRAICDVSGPMFANIIEGGLTEQLSARELANMGFCSVAYPWTLAANHVKSVRHTLDNLKKSFLVGAPPMILTYEEVCESVGFEAYWKTETRYIYMESENGKLTENGKLDSNGFAKGFRMNGTGQAL